MIKKKFIELVQTKLAGGQINSDIWSTAHPLVVAEYINLAMNTILYQVYKDKPESLNVYAKDLTLTVLNGTSGYYSEMPKSTLQFPGGDSGITRISLVDDMISLVFAEVSAASNSVFSRLGTTGRLNVIPYRYLSGTILFGINTRMSAVEEVIVTAVLPFSELDDTDDIVIPLGTGVTLVETVVGMMESKKPRDMSVNNTSS